MSGLCKSNISNDFSFIDVSKYWNKKNKSNLVAVDLFFGGGSVEIACSSRLGMEVIGYDIFDLLANYWDAQINNPTKLAAYYYFNHNTYRLENNNGSHIKKSHELIIWRSLKK